LKTGVVHNLTAEGYVRRRDFIKGIAGSTVVWPLGTRAQQPTMSVIGFLGTETPDLFTHRVRAFRQGLSDTGYVEGRNVAVEYLWAESQNDRLPALAADLVRRQVTVIVANGPAAVAAKVATTMVPIVFFSGGDPIERGLVASLNRPGGNLTGVSTLSVEVAPKQLQALHECVPTATTMALLINPTNPTLAETESRGVQAAAAALGLQLHVLHANTERDFNTVFATLVQLGAGALVIGVDASFTSRMEELAALALRHGMPAAYAFREFAVVGGLISYGSSDTDAFRLMGVYTGRILKGEKPADLPVQQSTKVELIINLKTAKALGITVPQSLLSRADEVIE
jgi:putative ABC transport system substrate-binding protein